MEELSTEQVARALDAWRARRRGTPTPEPPVEPRARRIWLTDAATQARRWEISPVPDRRNGDGQRLWPAAAVWAALEVATGPGRRRRSNG